MAIKFLKETMEFFAPFCT